MRGECIKFISLSFSLVSFQKLYFELFIARIMPFVLFERGESFSFIYGIYGRENLFS